MIVANNYNVLVLGYRERYSIKAQNKTAFSFQWSLNATVTCMVCVCCMDVPWKLCLFLVCFVSVFCHIRILLPLLLSVLEWCIEITLFMLHVVLVLECLQHLNLNNIVNVLQLQILLNLCAMAILLN